MGRFRAAIARFMYGRYGIDGLYYALLVLYLVLTVVMMFLRFWPLELLRMAVFVWAFYRVFSRNLTRRSAENAWFMGIWNRIKTTARLWKRRFAERKTHVYKTCPHCKAVVRLRRQAGHHTCTCPRCRRDFAVRM